MIQNRTKRIWKKPKEYERNQKNMKETKRIWKKPKEYVGESGFKRAARDGVQYLFEGKQQFSYGPKLNYPYSCTEKLYNTWKLNDALVESAPIAV